MLFRDHTYALNLKFLNYNLDRNMLCIFFIGNNQIFSCKFQKLYCNIVLVRCNDVWQWEIGFWITPVPALTLGIAMVFIVDFKNGELAFEIALYQCQGAGLKARNEGEQAED